MYFFNEVCYCSTLPAEKETIKEVVMNLKGFVLVLMETVMVSTGVIDYNGGVFNPTGKMPKTHYKN